VTGPPAAVRGQSQWALVWREFRQRRLALAAGGVLAVLITLSVFAPFIAHDRPIAYLGANRFQYNEALRTLRVLAREFSQGKVEAADAADQLTAMELQVALMSRQLPPEPAGRLRDLGASLQDLSNQALNDADARAELQGLIGELQREFNAQSVELAAAWHFPVIESLRPLDLVFMTATVFLLTIPLWVWALRKVVPPDRRRMRTAIGWGLLVGVPMACGLLWWLFVPGGIDRTDYKAGALADSEESDRAPVVYEQVAWPPIPYGLDQHNLDAKLLPPKARGLIPSFLLPESVVRAMERQAENPPPPGPWDGPHWLGTDQLGRDILCRMIWGGRVSLAVGIVAVSIYVTMGIIIGAVAGYFRGWVDLLISRFIEIVICFPGFFLILTIVAFVGPSIFNIMVVIGLTGWTGVARLVRGEFLRLAEQEFVLAGRALGYSPARIIFRHILPNAMAPVLVAATFGIAGAILTESALSFLGLGITVPQPSWGSILATGRDYIFRAPWIIYFPGIVIFLTITSYNLVGEAFRDAADPRLRGQNVRR
jgi:peptide/nickel transport system permease protein